MPATVDPVQVSVFVGDLSDITYKNYCISASGNP